MIRTNEVCNTSHLSFTSSSKMLQNTFWTKMFHTRILYMSDEKRAFCAFQNTVQFWGNHAWPDNILNVPKNALTLSGFQILELDESCPFWYKLNIVTAFPWLWSFCHMMLINAINAINLCNLEIDFKSWPSQEIHFKFCPSQETDFKSCPSQELQTGHGSPSTRGAPQGLPAMIMIVGQ